MGDSSGMCEIEEGSCCSEYSPEVDSYCSEYSHQVDNSTGKVSWILNKGWGIGKKLMVTGAVISSAPFVLPPLLVTSAIAFACWVPSGVVLASYACSEKIMSKLLPCNSTTVGVPVSNDEDDEEEFEDAAEGVKVDAVRYLDVEEEPMSEGIEGSRYEYNDDFQLDENAISNVVDVILFNVNEEEEYGVPQIEVTSTVLEESEGQEKSIDFLGEDKLVKETRGLLEKIRDEGNADHGGIEMDNQYVDGTVGTRRDSMDILLANNIVSNGVEVFVSHAIEGEGKIVIEESEEKEMANDFMDDEEVVEETGGLLDEIRYAGSANNVVAESYAGEIEQGEEATAEIIRSNFKKTKRDVDTDGDTSLGKPTHPMEAGVPKASEETEGKKHVKDANVVSEDQQKSKNSDNIVGAERPTGEISIVHNVLQAERPILDRRVDLRIASKVVEEIHTPAMNKEAILQAERAENNISQVKLELSRKKENVVFANADAREIADESGLYLFDEKNASGQQDAHTFDYRTPIYEGHLGGKGAEYAELPIPSRVESTDAKISSRKDNIHSNGVLNEDKIWKQIDAIRSIVGYKDKRQASYTEELKALYIFTGVEPPTSYDDPPDLARVDNKLRFLKAIIGLK